MSYTTEHILNCEDPNCTFCHRAVEKVNSYRRDQQNPELLYESVIVSDPDQLNLPSSIEQKRAFQLLLKDKILGGTLNPLEFYRQAKLVEDCIDELKKDRDIYEYAASERAKYGKEKAVINGSVIDTSSRTTYDYKSCNDSIWNDLKEKLSQREKYLKALPPQGAVDPDTGELVLPPTTKVSEFITVKI